MNGENTIRNTNKYVPITFEQLERSQQPEKFDCFLCKYGQANYNSIKNAKIRTIYEMFKQGYNSNILSPDELYVQLNEYYNHAIRTPAEKVIQYPEMSPERFKTHFENHLKSPAIWLHKSIRQLKCLQKVLIDQICIQETQKSGKKRKRIHTNNLKTLEKVNEQIVYLSNQIPEKMLGYDVYLRI